jgi:hypothetical protein
MSLLLVLLQLQKNYFMGLFSGLSQLPLASYQQTRLVLGFFFPLGCDTGVTGSSFMSHLP